MTESIVYRQTKALVREARERGIDLTKQGWMNRLLIARQKEKKAATT